jgi:glutaminyl-peptide cyclotransferase
MKPKMMAQLVLILLVLVSLTSFGCRAGSNENPASKGDVPREHVPKYGYEIVRTLPHDPDAFTQGLVFHNGKLIESTGQEGRSSLRSVEPETGKIERMVNIPSPYFAEGLTLINGKIYQVTWLDQQGFVYDASSFEKIGEFSYQGEGWGLTNDGKSLILSDGTRHIRFLDPDNFRVTKTIAVFDGRAPVDQLNELEYIQGEIYANIWHEDRIARINPQTGSVVGWIDLSGLLSPAEVYSQEAVLNGIAYDQASQRLFVTGKLWPKLFEIRLKLK